MTQQLSLEQQADAILAAHRFQANPAAVSAMQQAITLWLEAGPRAPGVSATPREAGRLLAEAMDRRQANRANG